MTDIITVNCGFVSCYILKNGDSAILVDTATKGSERKILSEMSRHGISPEALRLVVLTHGHTDHIGGCAYWRERRHIKVGIHPKDETVTKKLVGDTALGKMIALFTNIPKPITITPDIPLSESTNLNDYGIPARIIELPGHTDGSIALLLDDGRFISGDTFFNLGKPTFAHIAVDFDTLYKNRERLDSLGITTVYPGHGKPFDYQNIRI